jgi:TolB-like protein/DNA-binding winged helix-turn-helix (wHTH) protein
MSPVPDHTDRDFRLEDWLVQPAQCRLSNHTRKVQVRPKVMDLLTHLATHAGEVVSKEQLFDGVWGAEAVSESALTRTVTELRQALGDDAGNPRLLETIPKRGYRLIGSVSDVADDGVAITPRPPARARAKRWLLVFGVIAIAVLSALTRSAWLRDPSSGPVRIAVLPFDHLSDDRDRPYLADGLAEDTIASLGTIDPSHVVVVGRTSMRRYRSTTKSLTRIGQELSVTYLVEGVVRTEGQRLRLTSKLIRVRDEAVVWSQAYERDLSSVLGLQLEMSTAIAEQICGRIASLDRAHSNLRQQTEVKTLRPVNPFATTAATVTCPQFPPRR